MARFNWTYEEIVLAADLVAQNEWQGLYANSPEVIELSKILQIASLHPIEGRQNNFRSPNSIQRKTWDIATQHPNYAGKPTKGNSLDGTVLEEFINEPKRMAELAKKIRTLITQSLSTNQYPDLDLNVLAANEGREVAARHIRRERNHNLRAAKLTAVQTSGQAIICEVCGFDFGVYGELGNNYIEVHHIIPLSVSGPVLTKIEDLVLLCSNCHRMVHRANPWISPKELKERMSE